MGIIDGYSVHHKQGLVVIGCERSVATNFDVGSRTGRTAGLGDLHPGSLGGHCRNQITFPRFFEVATADTFDGITDGTFFAINAQGRDHNFAQLGGIAFHKNFHNPPLSGDLGGLHAQVGQAKGGAVPRWAKAKNSVGVGGRAIGGAFFHNGYPRQGGSVLGRKDFATDGGVLGMAG